jgi:hypothetical protein
MAFVSREGGAEGEGGGCELVRWPVYPPSPCGERLREARTGIPRGERLEMGKPLARLLDEDRRFIGLGEAARLAGLSAVQLSGLERGALTLAPEEWEELIALLNEARLAKPEGPPGP